MLPDASPGGHLLVLDTCTEAATVALFAGDALLEEVHLPKRAASTALLGTIRVLLHRYSIRLGQLLGVGVVSGPGSFTGVRIGLAAAKGMCEASARPLAAVSRLRVLADAVQLSEGMVLLGAGRDQVYALELQEGETGREWMSTMEELRPLLPGRRVAAGSPELEELLAGSGADVRIYEVSARHAITQVRRCLTLGNSNLVTADANYVRNEAAIYAKSAALR